MEEAVPVVGLGGVVPAPVRRLGVGEDDPDALVLAVGLAPDVEVALRRAGRRAPRRLEPRMLIGGVVDDQLGDDADVAAVRLGHEPIEVVQRAVARMDVLVVRDVVAVVAQRRRVERQQPQRVDAEPLQVVELLGQPGEVADAVVVAVEEGADVRLVDDGVLVPERVFELGHVKSQIPSSKSQPLPTPTPKPTPKSNSRLPSQLPTHARLGFGSWAWLGFGAWSLGFEAPHPRSGSGASSCGGSDGSCTCRMWPTRDCGSSRT